MPKLKANLLRCSLPFGRMDEWPEPRLGTRRHARHGIAMARLAEGRDDWIAHMLGGSRRPRGRTGETILDADVCVDTWSPCVRRWLGIVDETR